MSVGLLIILNKNDGVGSLESMLKTKPTSEHSQLLTMYH